MLGPSSRLRVYVYSGPVDMRLSFDGLSGLVRGVMEQDPLSGHLFCFFNRRRNYVKALYWDTNGYCLWSKRLVRGAFLSLPSGKELLLGDLVGVVGSEMDEPRTKRRRYQYLPS
jgi:transposase